MQLKHIPQITTKYWTGLVLASVFGANTGDFFSDVLGLGHLLGLPILAVLFTVVLFVEKRDISARELYFWFAIIVVRTAATNMGDIGHDLRLSPLLVMAGWSLVLAVTLAAWRAYDLRKNEGRCTQNSRSFASAGAYWFAMFLAGTLGTVAGDYFSFGLKLGTLIAALVLGAAVALCFLLGRNKLKTKFPLYWVTIILIRSAGTAAGDFMAHSFGLSASTLISGTVFVVFLIL